MMKYPTSGQLYTFFWNKYRPAIIKLMVDSSEGPQQYKFSKHELVGANPKKKTGLSFTLRAFQGQAVNNIKDCVLAKDLLVILKGSPTASELLENTTYEFSLDKDFMFHIKQEEEPEEVNN